MFFERIYEPGLSQASYVIGCQSAGTALVLDPRRDVDVYLECARREKLQITHIAETHIHADFLSGSRELSQLTGAELWLSDEGGPDWQYAFEHVGLRGGQTFRIGNLEFKALHTPGHTPEHLCFLLADRAVSPEPLMLFTGDCLFVGDVGRPDLLEKAVGIKGTQDGFARQLWDSLQQFRALPEFVQVWPAHGAGSACAKSPGSLPSSTLGYEIHTNSAFLQGKDAFVVELLSGQPEPPRYFAMMKKLNHEKRKVTPDLPTLTELDLTRFDIAVSDGALILDVRDRKSFATAHIPGSINIPVNKSLSTWAGWLVDYDRDLVLVARSGEVDRAVRALARIGLDRMVGYLPDITPWRNAGRKTGLLQHVLPADVPAMLSSGAVVLDIRGQKEHEETHIPESISIHGGMLRERAAEVPKDRPVILHCTSGGRSAIATSLLKSMGFENVYNLEGGIKDWMQEGLPVTRNGDSAQVVACELPVRSGKTA